LTDQLLYGLVILGAVMPVGLFAGNWCKLWFPLLQIAYVIRKILWNFSAYDDTIFKRAGRPAPSVLAEADPRWRGAEIWTFVFVFAEVITSLLVVHYVHHDDFCPDF